MLIIFPSSKKGGLRTGKELASLGKTWQISEKYISIWNFLFLMQFTFFHLATS